MGAIGLVISFIVFRGPNWKRNNFVLLSLVNLSLILVSLRPDSVNFLRDAFALQEYQFGRLIALLIASNIFLLFFSLYSHSKQNSYRVQFDKLVRSLVQQRIENNPAIADNTRPIMVIIPAFNESENLEELIPQILNASYEQELGIIVIDDGSEDNSMETLSRFPEVIAIKSPINRGGGAALRIGYDIAIKHGANICVTMDADGQHQPYEINSLVKPIMDNECDIVIGSRILGNRDKDSAVRFLGVYAFRFVINFLLGTRITDPSNGFRAFKIDVLKEVRLYEDQYHTTELLIEARKRNLKIKEVPITVLKRKHGKTKKGRNLIYGFNFARVILKTWWR